MTEKEKDNPHVSIQTCQAYRESLEKQNRATEILLEEKIKSLKNVIIAATTTTTIILGIVQIILTLVTK